MASALFDSLLASGGANFAKFYRIINFDVRN